MEQRSRIISLSLLAMLKLGKIKLKFLLTATDRKLQDQQHPAWASFIWQQESQRQYITSFSWPEITQHYAQEASSPPYIHLHNSSLCYYKR